MKSKSVRYMSVSILVAALLLLLSVMTAFAALTPPGSVNQTSWDTVSVSWTTGNNAGYWEGETAAMASEIVGQLGQTLELPICLQIWETPANNYGFTGFAAFNTTTRGPALPPPTLPNGTPITYPLVAPEWDTAASSIVYGYNIDIISVTAPVLGAPCDPNYLGVTVTYTPLTASGAYILWGGRIAQEGAALPAGSPDATVPAMKSARYVNGNFQARLKTSAADKTLTYKVNLGPNALTLTGLAAKPNTIGAWGVGLIGLAVLAGVVRLAWTRRQAR